MFLISMATALAFLPPPGDPHTQPVFLAPQPVFVENRGQWPEHVRFVLRQGGMDTLVTSTGFQTVLGREWSLFWKVGDGARSVCGEDPRPGRYHFFLGDDPAHWVAGAPSFGRVRCRDVLPGIDLVLRGTARGVEYDLDVAPGAGGRSLPVRCRGASSMRPLPGGGVRIETPSGTLTQLAPVVFRVDAGGTCRPESAPLTIEDADTLAWQVPVAPDRIVIDPELLWASFLAGGGDFQVWDSEFGSDGIWIAGQAFSPSFPLSPGAVDSTGTGGDSFALKMSLDGSSVLYATFLGGSGSDSASAMALDSQENVYLVGGSSSTDFPVTPGAFKPALSGFGDGTVARISADGSRLQYASYLGGSPSIFGDQENCAGAAVDSAGRLHVTGWTTAFDFPVTPNAYQTQLQAKAAFLTIVNPTGTAVDYSTYFGGDMFSFAEARDVHLRADGNIVIYGRAAGIPITPGAFDNSSGSGADLFMGLFDPTGTTLISSTYIGGDADEFPFDSVLGDDASIYMTGYYLLGGFPTTPGSFDPSSNGGQESFVARVASDGSSLVYSGSLGGNSKDRGMGLAVDRGGAAIVAGLTTSANFPTTTDAFQSGPGADAFLARISADGSAIRYATKIGGRSVDEGWQVAVDDQGRAWLSGFTSGFTPFAPDFPVTPGAFDTVPSHFCNGFMAAFDLCPGETSSFGSGCPRPAGSSPVLEASGCPSPGFELSISIAGAPPGCTGFLVFGTGTTSVAIGPGCTIDIAPLLPLVIPFGVPPSGDITFNPTIPPVPDTAILLQAILLDASAPNAVSVSNALRVHVRS